MKKPLPITLSPVAIALTVALHAPVQADIIAQQNFNALDATQTRTTDQVSSGEMLTNASASHDGSEGMGFDTLWFDTRAVNAGPVTAENDSSDFIGANAFAGNNSPNISADGTNVAEQLEQNFEFNDGDGALALTFDSVDLSGYESRTLSLKYWINSTAYEAEDSLKVELTDGTTTATVLMLNAADLEANASVDDDTTVWQSLDVDLDALIAAEGLGEQLQLIITADNDSGSENLFVDDVLFEGTPVNVDIPLSINELRIDQPGSDDDEYFELVGNPNESLDNLTYIVLGDGAEEQGSGVVEAVVDLTGQTLDENGFFLAAESTFSLATPTFETTLDFENSDNVTHMLVSNFTGARGDDLDTDDDGTIDVTAYDSVVSSVALIETPDTGELVYSTVTVGPDGNFVPAHVYRTADGDGVFTVGSFSTDNSVETPGATNTPDIDDPVVSLGICGDAATLVSQIQGEGDSSPLVGDTVVIEGVVTHGAASIGGVFVQEELADQDDNPATSEGLYLSMGDDLDIPATGTVVRALGNVFESFGKTQLMVTELDATCGTGSVEPVEVTLPYEANSLEAYENMLVTMSQTLTVSSNFNLGRFGEVVVSNGRLYKSTQLLTPGSDEERALEEENTRNQLIIDDNFNGSYADSPVYPNFAIGGLSADNTLRLGDTVTGATGTLDYGFSNFRLRPTVEPEFMPENPRTSEPQLTRSDVTIASFNVLNYFTTLDARGADTEEEFIRQTDKIIAALAALDSDVVGLMEIENNGFDENSAIADLTARLNAQVGEGTYAYVNNAGTTGTDQIMVAIIYKPAVVTPTDAPKVLSSANSPMRDGVPLFDDGRNRPSLAQQFTYAESGDSFVVNVNHLKSKGSSCGEGDDDTATGQGNCNGTRTRAAEAISIWLAEEYSDMATVIIGDLNAYAKEDPITTLVDAGYTDLAREFDGELAYGYSFRAETGSLDYAMANEAALATVVDVTDWNINADEPIALDYNVENQSPTQQAQYYAPDQYRASDHDPVVVSMRFVPLAPGDANGDGVVNVADYKFIASIFGSQEGDDEYVASADLDGDGLIWFNDVRLWYLVFIAQ